VPAKGQIVAADQLLKLERVPRVRSCIRDALPRVGVTAPWVHSRILPLHRGLRAEPRQRPLKISNDTSGLARELFDMEQNGLAGIDIRRRAGLAMSTEIEGQSPEERAMGYRAKA